MYIYFSLFFSILLGWCRVDGVVALGVVRWLWASLVHPLLWPYLCGAGLGEGEEGRKVESEEPEERRILYYCA